MVTIDGEDYTTDSLGQVKVYIADAGTYAWTVMAERFVSQMGNVTIGDCGAGGTVDVTVYLLPEDGFVCQNKYSTTNSYTTTKVPFPYPIPTTLTLTDSVWGSCTMTYNVAGGYYSCTIEAIVNNCDCPETFYPITYVWQGPCTSGGGYLSISTTYFFPNRLETPCLVDLSCEWLGGADPCYRGEGRHSTGFTVSTGAGIADVVFTIDNAVPFSYMGQMPCKRFARRHSGVLYIWI